MKIYPEFEAALIGTTSSIGPIRAVYDYNRILEVLMADGGYGDIMEAIDHLESSYCCWYHGDDDPIIVYPQEVEAIMVIYESEAAQ